MAHNGKASDRVRVVPLHESPILPLVQGAGEARALLHPEMGARQRAFYHIELAPSAATVTLSHLSSEAVYYVVSGTGAVADAGSGESLPVRAGNMFYVDPGRPYQLCAADQDAAVFVGGPCPPDALPVNGAPAPAREDGCGVHMFDALADGVLTPLISRDARLVVGPHTGARQAVMNRVVLEPGEANTPHRHATSEDTIFVVEGRGVIIDHDLGREYAFAAPCALLVPVGIQHSVAAPADRVLSVGGPVPADRSMLKGLGVDL